MFINPFNWTKVVILSKQKLKHFAQNNIFSSDCGYRYRSNTDTDIATATETDTDIDTDRTQIQIQI